jgi:hypothetical protein
VKVEVLYVLNCPHHAAAVRQLKKVLLAEGATAEIREVEVKDAKEIYGC